MYLSMGFCIYFPFTFYLHTFVCIFIYVFRRLVSSSSRSLPAAVQHMVTKGIEHRSLQHIAHFVSFSREIFEGGGYLSDQSNFQSTGRDKDLY